MRIIIVGAGAIGGSLAAELALSGADVLVVARGAHGQRIADAGLHYRTPHQECQVPLAIVPAIEELELGRADLAILTTKLGDTEAAAKSLAQLDPALPVLALQNGVAGESMAAKHMQHVYGGMVYLPATYLEEGSVDNYCSNGPGALRMGPYQGESLSIFDQLTSSLVAAGFHAATVDAIMPWKYGKLLTNLGNALQLVCTTWSEAGALYAGAVAEGEACLQAAGIPYLSVDELVAAVSVETDKIAGKARPGGSMWQSVARKRAPEVDYLNGLIVELGSTRGVPTPVNSMLVKAAWQTYHHGTRYRAEELAARV